MFKDTQEGTTHSYNDGCGDPIHNNKKPCHLSTTYDPTCVGCKAVNDKELDSEKITKLAKKAGDIIREAESRELNDEKEKKCDCPKKYCPHYESDFDRFVKENPYVQDTSSTCKTIPVHQEESWEEEFDRKFGYERNSEVPIKDFIHQVLSSERELHKEEINAILNSNETSEMQLMRIREANNKG